MSISLLFSPPDRLPFPSTIYPSLPHHLTHLTTKRMSRQANVKAKLTLESETQVVHITQISESGA